MAGVSLDMQGLEDVTARLVGLERRVQDREMRAALRAGAQVFRDALRARLPGRLAKDVTIASSRAGGPGTVAVKVRFRRYERIVRWREEGTPPHDIVAKRKKALGGPRLGHPVRRVHHPGQPARPVVGPVATGFQDEAVAAVRRRLLERLEAAGL